MKRILAALLVASMAVGLAACGGNGTSSEPVSGEQSTTTPGGGG